MNRVLLTQKNLTLLFHCYLPLLFIQIHAASEMLALPFYGFAHQFLLAKYFPSETLEPAHMYDTPLTL